MSHLHRLLASSNAPSTARQAALDRAHRDPGIPSMKGTTRSFWMKDKHPTINDPDQRPCPNTIDVAIVGSGITGLSVAHTILNQTPNSDSPRLSVMMLEAREVCSGATGRNGGHCLETVGEYLDFKKQFGQDDAKRLIRFRRGHLSAFQELVGSNQSLKEFCQLREVEFLSVYFDQSTWSEAVENIKEFMADMPEEAKGFAIHTGDKLTGEFGLSEHAIGAVSGPAGAVWPYRLVTCVLRDLLRDNPSCFFLRTSAPVASVTLVDERDTTYPYRLETPQGTVYARHVVHCTNAHVGHLVPGLRGRVVPLRGQMSAQEPGSRFGSQGKKHSWVFNYRIGFDYLTQLPQGGSGCAEEMMLGGGLVSMPSQGLDEVGVSADDDINLAGDIHLSGALSAIFGRKNWGSSAGVKYMWTGILGMTPDSFPWVGELPHSLTGRRFGKDLRAGEWAAAGFCGEGMVQAWGSGKALALMLLHKENPSSQASRRSQLEQWFPTQMCITEDRISAAILPRSVAKNVISNNALVALLPRVSKL